MNAPRPWKLRQGHLTGVRIFFVPNLLGYCLHN
jgi:hypothetical protein